MAILVVVAFELDRERAAADDGICELADLIALRQIRIEVVLPIENRVGVNLGADGEAERDGHAHDLFVQTGSTPGRPRSTGQAWVLGSAPKVVQRRKRSCSCGELDVDFQADDAFPLHQ